MLPLLWQNRVVLKVDKQRFYQEAETTFGGVVLSS